MGPVAGARGRRGGGRRAGLSWELGGGGGCPAGERCGYGQRDRRRRLLLRFRWRRGGRESVDHCADFERQREHHGQRGQRRQRCQRRRGRRTHRSLFYHQQFCRQLAGGRRLRLSQASAALGPGAAWNTVTNLPVNAGSQQTVPLTPTTTTQFYRLEKP